jgi:SAM-dependent MidA family methyltransferase
MSLPQPHPEAIEHSNRLKVLLRDKILADGPMPFARFMQHALYEPGLGYYLSGLRKIGVDGDFVTAPEISPLFAQCLALQCLDIMQNMPGAGILEFGAGSGAMAADILLHLHKHTALPEYYYILELSAELRERQQQTIEERAPALFQKVVWLNSLNNLSINGIVLANEVLDAMPVERFVKRDAAINRIAVDWDKSSEDFYATETTADDALRLAVAELENNLHRDFPEGYCSEINLQLKPWFNSLSDNLRKGVVLITDYGYPQAEYYLPERNMGTLMCHYQHRAHAEPLLWVGLQDITAHVDFTAVAEAAATSGMQVAGFTEQVRFLLDSGIENLLAETMQSADLPAQVNLTQQAKTLLMPGQMGEQFKVMAAAKQYNHGLTGFSKKNDLRHRL